MTPAPVGGPCAWRGEELTRSARWLWPLEDRALGELDAALRHARARKLPWHALTPERFPLPTVRALLADVARELEEGCGLVTLRGLPVARYTPDELRTLWFGLGTHLGHPVHQNRRGELMREIRDEGRTVGDRYGQLPARPGESGPPVLSSYARTLSNGALRFHTDRCDVVGLLCVRQARRGGASRLCSSVAVHDELLRRAPELAAALYEPIPRSRFGEEADRPDDVYALPVFGVRDGKFTSHYSLTFIEVAQRVAGVPPLSPVQRAALEQLAALADELAFDTRLEPGDMQFLNNHVVYHARTAFEDDAEADAIRLLYRLWLAMPNSRALPAGHEVLWGRIEAGAVRGGIGQIAAS